MLRSFGLAVVVTLGLSALAHAADPAVAPAPAPTPAGADSATAPDPSVFDVTGVEVVAERDVPQVCFTFNARIGRSRPATLKELVTVEPAAPITVLGRNEALCFEGLAHGTKYHLTLLPGLSSADGRRFEKTAGYDIEVPNRTPSLAFRGGGYMLPRVGAEGLPLRTINVDKAQLQVLRINDRDLVEKIYFGRVTQSLSEWDVGELVAKAGREVWKGEQAIGGPRNVPVVTPFPIETVLATLEPGVHIAVAGSDTVPGKGWEGRATQWFVVSDLGLTTFEGEDGLLVFARSLATAEPLAGVELRLLARGNAELGKATTGADGMARFDAALLRGQSNDAPQALFAYGGSGDIGFLDLSTPAFDLTDRGVGGREAPGPLDAFLYTERGIYRPGETVNVSALLRDAKAAAVAGTPLTLKVFRPDGAEAARVAATAAGAGAYTTAIEVVAQALTGTWTVTAHVEPEGPAVGKASFLVEDFVPPRLELSLEAGRRVIPEDGKAALAIDARTLYGAPARTLPGELSLTLRTAPAPYPQHPGYRFGLAQEDFQPVRTELPGFTTDAKGRAKADIALAQLPDTSHPVEAVIRGTLFDFGRRPVARELVMPVWHQPFAIGIKPRFDGDAVPENATVGFDVITVAPDGTPLDKTDLSYELFEEDLDYVWFEADGHWDYKTEVRDRRLTGGTLSVATGKPAAIEEPVKAGRYRLEVFDPANGVATSVRFAAGWWARPTAVARPDKVDVSVMMANYKAGDVARVYVKPPYAGQVLIAIADREVRKVFSRSMGPEGAFLEIPVDADWTAGVYVLATAFAPADPVKKTQPRRAMGSSWLALDPASHTLTVKVGAPAEALPRQTLSVPVAVEGVAAGEEAFVTVSAVDDTVLQVTDFTSPDPNAFFLGKRRLAVELRDVYGRLIEPAGAGAAKARPGAPAAPGTDVAPLRPVSALPARSARVVSLYSGVLAVGADGQVQVPVVLPDFQGRLRLMAVAWTANRVGHADATVTVRDPMVADATVPRFLAPGDRARVTVSLDNGTGVTGDYSVRLLAEGAASVDGGPVLFKGLAKGKRASTAFDLVGGDAGTGTIRLEVTGPNGATITRTWTVPVRPGRSPIVRRLVSALEPGKTLAIPPETTEGLRPETVAATLALSLSPQPEFDVPGLLLALERYPNAAAEPLASRVLSLLGTEAVAPSLGLGEGLAGAAEVRDRVQRTLGRLLALQRADGSFGLWSARGEPEMWLTAYVLDVLGRARAAGYTDLDPSWRQGMDWLKKTVDRTWFDEGELPARAYAYLVLARAKLVDSAAVRWFRETYWARLQTDFSRAQVAGALAALGDAEAAKAAFAQLGASRLQFAGLRDFGSDLRDQAGVLALLAESGFADRDRLLSIARKLAARFAETRTVSTQAVSTQEAAWLIQASRALADRADPFKLEVDGTPQDGIKSYSRRIDPAAPPVVKNLGSAPLGQVLSIAGIPVEPPSAEAHGFAIERKVFDMKGNPVDLTRVRPNDVLVVILEGESLDGLEHRALVVDRLPAGLEIENVRLADSAQLGDLSWLGELSAARHVEFRDDRFVAAIDLHQFRKTFRLVYLARAVTPGDFEQPGVLVEDMYKTGLLARGAAGRLTVTAD